MEVKELIKGVERVQSLRKEWFKNVNLRAHKKRDKKNQALNNELHDRVEWSEEFERAKERDAQAKEGRK